MLTSKDIAKALKVTEQTVRQYARDGRIPFQLTPGGHRRFDLDDVRLALRLARPAALAPLDLDEDAAAPRLGDVEASTPLVRTSRWQAVPITDIEDIAMIAPTIDTIPFFGTPGRSRFVQVL